MTIYTNVFSGQTISPSYVSYQSYVYTASTLTLTWPVPTVNNANNAANVIDLSTVTGGTHVIIPPATQVSPGQAILFNNVGAQSIVIKLNDTTTTLVTLGAGQSIYCYLTDNSTDNGTWRNIPFGGGIVSVTSVAATSSNANLTIAGSPITSSGTFVFNLAKDLAALTSFGSGTGYAARTAADTWSLRQITGTANQIASTNPAGVAGNTILSLEPNITGITSIKVSNINIGLNSSGVGAQNTIASSNANGNITLDPNGTGEVQSSKNITVLSGTAVKFQNPLGTQYISFAAGNLTSNIALTWPTAIPLATQVLQYAGAGVLQWANVSTSSGSSTLNAIARYSNTTGALKDSIVLIDDTGNIGGAASITVGPLNINTTSNVISTSAGNLILNPNGTNEVLTLNNINITTAKLLKLSNGTPGNYIGFKASVAGTVTNTDFVLPLGDGGFGDVFAVTNGAAVLSTATIPGRNRLMNGDFQIWQAGTTFNSTGGSVVATADGWGTKAVGALSVDVTRSSSGILYAAKVQRTAANANTNTVVFAQTLRRNFCVGMPNNRITLSFKLQAGANFSGSLLTASIYSGQDAADVGFLTSGFTSQTLEDSISINAPSTTLTQYSFTTDNPISVNATQLAVQFSYTPSGTAGADDSFTVTDVMLERSIAPTGYDRLCFTEQLSIAEAAYNKSFLYATAPAQNAGANTGEINFIAGVAGALTCNSGTILFPARMYSVPTITLYNPEAASAQIRNQTQNENLTASATYHISDTGFALSGTGSAGTAVGDRLAIHYVADARLT